MVKISEELIIRFINNTCTDEELVAIKNWLDESDEKCRQTFRDRAKCLLWQIVCEKMILPEHE